MRLIVQGKQMRVGAWLREYAEKHVVQRLRRFADSSAAVLRIEMGKANGNRGEAKELHLTFRMPGARTIEIEETMPDLYQALDAAADRLVRAAKKEREKMRQPKGRHKERPLGSVAARRAASRPACWRTFPARAPCAGSSGASAPDRGRRRRAWRLRLWPIQGQTIR